MNDAQLKPIIDLYDELVKEIHEYESDTFSSSDSEITLLEAEKIASILICRQVKILVDTETMDGCIISEELEELR